MDITIIETGEEAELSIIDPKTGICWINDLMGNHGALPDYDDETGRYQMQQEDFDWWENLTTQYQTADNRYNKILSTLDNDKYENMLADTQNINCDLEDYPAILMGICDGYDHD